jgi:hypothetical protein
MTDSTYMASVYRLEAVNFRMSAETLCLAFKTPREASPGSISALPFYFLISHATELLLKVALLKRGFTEPDLKQSRYRHSLVTLMEELQNKGVSLSPEAVRVVTGLHPQHESHALRYTALVEDGRKTYMPPPSIVFEMLDELLLLTRISTQGA